MLNLSPNQLSRLEDSLGGRFRARLEQLTLQLRPDLEGKVTPEVLSQFVDVAMQQARTLDFHTEFEQAAFLAGTLLQGRDFHLDPRHPLYVVVNRAGIEPRLRASQLLYELERIDAARRASAGVAA